jgi:hypothetical protein
MRTIGIILSVICVISAYSAHAESEYLDFMKARYNIPNTSKLNSCTTCHSGIGGSWPRNSYGSQLETAGVASDMASAFDTTDPMNADNDAALNWVELVNGTWPADADDFVPVDAATWGRIKKLFN